MDSTDRVTGGEALTGTILDLFRVTSLLLTAGDRLVAHLGLTSARWQILGAMAAAGRPEPVAWLARDMGVARQNVQRIVNDLREAGLVAFSNNPHHRRAQLVGLTDRGRQVFGAAMRLQAPWMADLADGLTLRDIRTFHRVVLVVRRKLEEAEHSRETDAARPARASARRIPERRRRSGQRPRSSATERPAS